MSDLTKDEVVEMAREAGAVFDPQWGIASNTGTATFERFATLCRAPLVAEVERLEQWHAEMADNRNAIASERDTLKAELARVWAGEPDCATTGVCVRSGLYASTPSAVPVVEQMVEALKGVVVGADESWTQACKELNSMGITSVPVSNASAGLINRQIEAIDVARTAIAAGQKFIKENGK